MEFGREVFARGQRWIFDPVGRFVSPPDPGPYDPCWCWSGKKFKFCHMHRDRENRPSVADALNIWKAKPDMRICLGPKAPTECSGKVVDAHMVQRHGGGLSKIAREGKVYGFKRHPMFFIKKQGFHEPELIGIGAAATLPIFCEKHDRDLFRNAETESFAPTMAQLLQLNYRTVASRVYTNEAVIPQLAELHDADRGLTRDDQRRMFVAVEALRQESAMYLENVLELKALYDEWITATNADVNALVIRFQGRPEFMCASIVYANMDFQGALIAPVGRSAHLCFYTVADDAGVSAVYSWVGENHAASQLCSSLLTVPPEHRASAILRYALEYIDTTFFAPDWWESLGVEVRGRLVQRLTAHSKPFREHRADGLLPDSAEASRLQFGEHQIIGKWRDASPPAA